MLFSPSKAAFVEVDAVLWKYTYGFGLMADVRKLEDVFWEEVLEDEWFEQYEFIAVRMKEKSAKRTCVNE